MSTAIAIRPFLHRPRRVLLSVAVAVMLAVGAGAAAVSLTSSDNSTTSTAAHPAPTVAVKVDTQALWNTLGALPVDQRDNLVAGLTPTVRAQLRAIAEAIAVSAESH